MVWSHLFLSTNATRTMCYEHLVCEEECCHDLDFGIPYCCSKYTGFIYLGLMVGGGVIIAVLVIACYIFMKRTERELEAAAKLEAAKAANQCRNGLENSTATEETDLDNPQDLASNLGLPPPAYRDVMRTFTRCQSCDVSLASSAQSIDMVNSLIRQYSEGSQAPLRGLPVLVDIQELIARHRRENGALGQQQPETGLPLIVTQESLDNKLPTYEECSNHQMEVSFRNREAECSNRQMEVSFRSRETEYSRCQIDVATGSRDTLVNNEIDSSQKLASNILSRLGNSHDNYIDIDGEIDGAHKLVGERNVYFENMNEVIQGMGRKEQCTEIVMARKTGDICHRNDRSSLCDAHHPIDICGLRITEDVSIRDLACNTDKSTVSTEDMTMLTATVPRNQTTLTALNTREKTMLTAATIEDKKMLTEMRAEAQTALTTKDQTALTTEDQTALTTKDQIALTTKDQIAMTTKDQIALTAVTTEDFACDKKIEFEDKETATITEKTTLTEVITGDQTGLPTVTTADNTTIIRDLACDTEIKYEDEESLTTENNTILPVVMIGDQTALTTSTTDPKMFTTLIRMTDTTDGSLQDNEQSSKYGDAAQQDGEMITSETEIDVQSHLHFETEFANQK